MVCIYLQRDTDDNTEDKFSDLISGADDEIREKYNAEAELINDDFLLHQLTDTEDMCTNDTETAQSEEEEVSVTKVSSSSDLTSHRIELLR